MRSVVNRFFFRLFDASPTARGPNCMAVRHRWLGSRPDGPRNSRCRVAANAVRTAFPVRCHFEGRWGNFSRTRCSFSYCESLKRWGKTEVAQNGSAARHNSSRTKTNAQLGAARCPIHIFRLKNVLAPEIHSQDEIAGLVSPREPAFSTKHSVHPVHLLPHSHASDEQDQQSRGRAQNAHIRGHSLHSKLELLLFSPKVGTGIVQKELIVLV